MLEALIRLLQLLTPRLGQLVPALEVLEDPRFLLRWQPPETPHLPPGGFPLLGRERTPMPVVLEHPLALLRPEPLPPLPMALHERFLVGRHRQAILPGRLTPRELEDTTRPEPEGQKGR